MDRTKSAGETETIASVLAGLRADSPSSRELGDRIERLIRAYLKADPLYAERFSEVWLWQGWPDRGGQPDTGIDLVATEREGGVCAIQCKFYDPAHRLEKSDIDSFFTTSGKAPFTSRLIVSTTDHWSKHAEKALEKQQVPVTRLRWRISSRVRSTGASSRRALPTRFSCERKNSFASTRMRPWAMWLRG